MKIKFLYYSVWVFIRLISKLILRIQIKGREHIPRQGGFILACNHRSYIDPLMAGSWSPRHVYFFAKKELFHSSIVGYLLKRVNTIPVRRGTVDRGALDHAVDVIEKGYGLTLFPEGTRCRTGEFLKPKAGVGLVALRACCPIVPVYMHGTDKLIDCFLGKEKLKLFFGPPLTIDWLKSLPEDKSSYAVVAEEVMKRIRELASAADDHRESTFCEH